MTMSNPFPPIMPEEYWANSHLSIARYYGQVQINDSLYIIVDKHGHDIFHLSAIAERAGRAKAIEPGEPADLCQKVWIPSYKALGRDRILQLVKEGKTLAEVKKIVKELKKNAKP